jgi:hypothetical protein
MNVSREEMLALERHFVGALSAPARTWLEPVPASQLAFAGRAITSRSGGCAADLGVVESPGREVQFVRVINRDRHPVLVHIGECPRWLSARWCEVDENIVPIAAGAAGATLELTVTHDTENELLGRIRFLVTNEGVPRIEELPVRMTARRAYPIARFDFNGSPVPRDFAFGNGARPYRFSVSNDSSVPLVVRFADLPEWLTFEVGGQRRDGPLAGPFFERRAPFTIRLWARAAVPRRGVVRLETNDPRPQCRSLALPFSAGIDGSAAEKETTLSRPPLATERESAPEFAGTVPVQRPRSTLFMIRGGVLYAVAALLLIVLVFFVLVLVVRELA